ncbi:hypothetical protein C8T65DRAFT_526951, partial [Cerioporus squamosus]
TLRHHLDSSHRGLYHRWALGNNFVSKLQSNVDKLKAAAEEEKKCQSTLELHLREMTPKERKIVYTECVYRKAVIEWLIATNQVCTHTFEHP